MAASAMKYIIIKGYIHEKPFLFPACVNHNEMAALINPYGEPIVAAGFVDLVDGDISAHGESTSLGIKSRPQDSQVISRHLGDAY